VRARAARAARGESGKSGDGEGGSGVEVGGRGDGDGVARLCTGEGGGATANGGKAVLADWAAASKPASRAAS
jgi:hypothetical protein